MRARGLHPEQVGRGAEAVLRTQTDAAGRVPDAGPEVRGVPVSPQVVPDDEVVRPRRGLQLERLHVHGLPVGRRAILASFAVGAGRDDERRHAHLEAVARLVEVQPLRLDRATEKETRERRRPDRPHAGTPTPRVSASSSSSEDLALALAA